MEADRPLPAGIVAFVFTDIEGSTRLFRKLGDGFVRTLERHNELLRRAWSRHRGHEVKTEGDGFFVAFEDAGDAIHACVEAQRALAVEPWADEITVRARMGIHAGLAYPRGHDYVALAVHQSARVESAAHGGQILVSDQAAELVDRIDGATLEPVGTYRVRDFDDPIRLFQVHAEGLEERFPAVGAIPADRHNLSRPHTSFVGRAGALEGIARLLVPGRLVTVVGPGGVGKTRVVTELGLAVASQWRDGVWLVDLSPVDDDALIPSAIADAIGAALPADAEAWTAVIGHLRERRALVILDTSEHLISGLIERVDELLATCPTVTVLATSRVPWGAQGEQLWRLEPLETDDEEGSAPAMELFAERAAAIDPGFSLDETTRATVAAICRRVDGLPLAIELAAARVGVLSVEEILVGLEDRFRILRSRDRTIPERQRTLEASLDWSERLLAPDERAMLRSLSVFADTFGLAEAAAAAVDDVDPDRVPELVWTLAESSLVAADRSLGTTRYRLLGSVQAYAQQELERGAALAPTAVRLGRWYQERFFQDMRFRRDRLAELRTSIDNVRGVLAQIEGHAPETAQWLACAIGDYNVLLTRFRSGAEELSDLVSRLTRPTLARVYLLVVYADLLLWSDDPDGAARMLDAAEELRELVGSPSDGTDWSIAYDRADLARRGGDPKATIDVAQRTLDQGAGDAGRSRMLNILGVAWYELGDFDAATAAFEEGLVVDTRVEHEQNIAIAHANLAELAVILDRPGPAAEHALACLRRSGELGMSATVGMAISTAAHLSADAGDVGTAVRLAAHSVKIHEQTGFEPAAEEQGPTLEELYANGRRVLGDHRFEEERAAGRALSLPDGIKLAAQVLGELAGSPPGG